MRKAVIVAAGRSPVGKAPRGSLRHTRPDDIAAQVIRAVIERAHPLPTEDVEDVILGCAMPEGEQGTNVARIAALRAGLPDQSSAMTVNRFCSSGLQTIALANQSVATGSTDVVVAGGTESMSLIPREGYFFSPNPYLVEEDPDVYISMGITAENLAIRNSIDRRQQDEFSLRSHTRAMQAQDAGRFDQELIPLVLENGKNGTRFEQDEGVRRDTSIEALSKLRPVFHARGTVTAGNSSQTSDAAAAAVVMSEEKARELELQPMARLISFATAGVAPEIMGIGPVEAVPKALRIAGLTLKDIGLIELNEAFAVQALAVIQELGLDQDKVNVNGGAVALGHPLGATGAKLTATLLYEMERRGVKYGMVTMCVGGGMGAAGVFESLRV
jgi:acetyl-CoA acyltransferase